MEDLVGLVSGQVINPPSELDKFMEDYYDYVKLICNCIPKMEELKGNFPLILGNFNNFESSTNLTQIPLDVTLEMAKDIIQTMFPTYSELFKKYLTYVKFQKGSSHFSGREIILYEENINDLYVVIHEFMHYCCHDQLYSYDNRDLPLDIFRTASVVDEAKSILSEEFVKKLLEEKVINFSDYGIDIKPYDIESHSYFRLIEERELSSNFIFMYNLRKIIEECQKKQIAISQEIIEKYFLNFGADSVEYMSFKENINNPIIYYRLKNNPNNFFNTNYYGLITHPLSFITSLDLMEVMQKNSSLSMESIIDMLRDVKNNLNLSTTLINGSSLAEKKPNDVLRLLNAKVTELRENYLALTDDIKKNI